jgi:hypothetical protein
MALTIFGITFLIGATLSSRFKVSILFSAFGLAILWIAGAGIAHGDHIGAVILTIVLVSAALQIGYLFGVVTRGAIASLSVPERKAVAAGRSGLR